ncbi:MAG: hypothetical protein V1875_05755 [Candidatus Altiarchaeota archaeon]
MDCRKLLVLALVTLVLLSLMPPLADANVFGTAWGGLKNAAGWTWGVAKAAGRHVVGFGKEVVNCNVREWNDTPTVAGKLGWFSTGGSVKCAELALVKEFGKVGYEMILSWIAKSFGSLISTLVYWLQTGLVYNPGWNDYDGLIAIILMVLLPFLMLQIVYVGGLLIFSAINPQKRSKAKDSLVKLITALILISVSKPIYIMLYDLIVGGLTVAIFDKANSLLGTPMGAVPSQQAIGAMFVGILTFAMGAGIIISMLWYVALFLLLAILIVFIRWAMIVFFYIIFPFTLFLYFSPLDYTRNMGGNLLMKTLLWLSMAPVMALILCITILAVISMLDTSNPVNSAIANALGNGATPPAGTPLTLTGVPWQNGLGSRFMALGMFLSGLMALVAVPLIMGELLKWVGGAMAASGMVGLTSGGSRVERWKNMGMVFGGGDDDGAGPNKHG